MKALISWSGLLVTWLVVSATLANAQCYRCGADSSSWESITRGPDKALKKQFPDAGKVNWYACEFGYVFGVRNYGDSTKTYIFSKNNEWLGTETRSTVVVPVFYDGDVEPDPGLPGIAYCVGPDILPAEIRPSVAQVFGLSDLDTLNKTDGKPFWVCDLFKVELPKNHPVCKQERTTVFYVANMDFVFHVYTASRELFFPNSNMTYHGYLYVETETIYEQMQVDPVPPVEYQNNGGN